MTFLILKVGVKELVFSLDSSSVVGNQPASNKPATSQQQASQPSMATTQSTDGSGAPHQVSPSCILTKSTQDYIARILARPALSQDERNQRIIREVKDLKARIYCAVPPHSQLASMCFQDDPAVFTSMVAKLIEMLRDVNALRCNRLSKIALYHGIRARLKYDVLRAIKISRKAMGTSALDEILVETQYVVHNISKAENLLRQDLVKNSRRITRILAHFTTAFPQYKF